MIITHVRKRLIDRELGVSMDSLQLRTWWDKSNVDQSSSQIVASLSGIYIQGAKMVSGIGIEECRIDTPSWTPIPICYLTWVPSDETVSQLFSILS